MEPKYLFVQMKFLHTLPLIALCMYFLFTNGVVVPPTSFSGTTSAQFSQVDKLNSVTLFLEIAAVMTQIISAHTCCILSIHTYCILSIHTCCILSIYIIYIPAVFSVYMPAVFSVYMSAVFSVYIPAVFSVYI